MSDKKKIISVLKKLKLEPLEKTNHRLSIINHPKIALVLKKLEKLEKEIYSMRQEPGEIDNALYMAQENINKLINKLYRLLSKKSK